jgi:hypothetical protein
MRGDNAWWIYAILRWSVCTYMRQDEHSGANNQPVIRRLVCQSRLGWMYGANRIKPVSHQPRSLVISATGCNLDVSW